jgi:hypothetical protein
MLICGRFSRVSIHIDVFSHFRLHLSLSDVCSVFWCTVSVVVLCCTLSVVSQLSNVGCRGWSGVTVGVCCWFLIVVRRLSGVGCLLSVSIFVAHFLSVSKKQK